MKKIFKLNQTMPYTDEYFKVLREVFGDNLGEICIGKHAIVGAASVVTHDVPDYAVVVGNPARVIKTLDKTKFKD